MSFLIQRPLPGNLICSAWVSSISRVLTKRGHGVCGFSVTSSGIRLVEVCMNEAEADPNMEQKCPQSLMIDDRDRGVAEASEVIGNACAELGCVLRSYASFWASIFGWKAHERWVPFVAWDGETN
jgi:hypothetical protein